MSLDMFPWVAKLAGNKENVLLLQWQNEETLSGKTNELRMRTIINWLPKSVVYIFSAPGLHALHVIVNLAFDSKQNSCFVYDIVWTTKVKELERKAQIEIGWEEKRREGHMQVS